MSNAHLRKLLCFFVFILPYAVTAQEWRPSKSYRAVGVSTKILWKYAESFPQETKPYKTRIVSASDKEDVLFHFSIEWPETFDSLYIDECVDQRLKNVGKVLKVQIEFASCCYNITTHYLLITKVGDVIELPKMDYVMCDWPCDVPGYEFDEDGSTIRMVNRYHGNSGKVTSVKTVKTLKWNGYKLI